MGEEGYIDLGEIGSFRYHHAPLVGNFHEALRKMGRRAHEFLEHSMPLPVPKNRLMTNDTRSGVSD
jgi:hypothetical protein